jgi:hypothetical protein
MQSKICPTIPTRSPLGSVGAATASTGLVPSNPCSWRQRPTTYGKAVGLGSRAAVATTLAAGPVYPSLLTTCRVAHLAALGQERTCETVPAYLLTRYN